MVESKAVDDPQSKHKPNRKVRFLKMKVMKDLTSESIVNEVKKCVKSTATIRSDEYRGYSKLKEAVSTREVIIEPDKKKAEKIFPWVNRTISNAKKVLLGIHHNAIHDKFVQNYFDEFCYKFNRRHFGGNLSARLVSVALTTTWY